MFCMAIILISPAILPISSDLKYTGGYVGSIRSHDCLMTLQHVLLVPNSGLRLCARSDFVWRHLLVILAHTKPPSFLCLSLQANIIETGLGAAVTEALIQI